MEAVPDGNHVTTTSVTPSVDVTDHQSDVTPDHHSDVSTATNQYYHKNEVTMPIHYGDDDVTPQPDHNLKQPHYMSTINLNIKQSLENHSNLEVMSRNYRSTSRLNGEESPESVKKMSGVENDAFEPEEPYSNGDVKSTFDHSKPYNEKPMTETVNLELINMKPAGVDVVGTHQNGVINEIPVKKDEDVEIGNPYDEYFVPVNEHRKYMRGEKLYVTVDKRNKKSRNKCLCWTVCLCVVIAALVIGILAAVGAIGVKEPIKEISARHFSGNEAPIKGAAVFGDVNVTSPEPPTTPPGLLFVPRALEAVMVVDNLEYSESLAQKYSSEYRTLAESLAEQLKVTLFTSDYLKYGSAGINLKILNFRPGSVVVRFRVAWSFKPGIHNVRDPITAETMRRKFQNVRERHGGYLANYHVTLTNVTMVIDECEESRGCEWRCQFDYLDSLEFVCLCPDGQQLGGDGKTCVERERSTEVASEPNRSAESNARAEVEERPESESSLEPVIPVEPQVVPEPEATPETTQDVGQSAEPEVEGRESRRPESEHSSEPGMRVRDPTEPEVVPEPEATLKTTQDVGEPEVEEREHERPEPEPSHELGILVPDATEPEASPEPEVFPVTTQVTKQSEEPEVEGREPEPSSEPGIPVKDETEPEVAPEPEAIPVTTQNVVQSEKPEVEGIKPGRHESESSSETGMPVRHPTEPEVVPEPEATPETSQDARQRVEPEAEGRESGKPESEPSSESGIPVRNIAPEPEVTSETTQNAGESEKQDVEGRESGRPESESSPELGTPGRDPTEPEVVPEPKSFPEPEATSETTQNVSQSEEPEVEGRQYGRPELSEPETSTEPTQTSGHEPEVAVEEHQSTELSQEPKITTIEPEQPEVTTEPLKKLVVDGKTPREPEIKSKRPEVLVEATTQPETNFSAVTTNENLLIETEMTIKPEVFEKYQVLTKSVEPEVTTKRESLEVEPVTQPEVTTESLSVTDQTDKKPEVITVSDTADESKEPEVLVNEAQEGPVTEPEVTIESLSVTDQTDKKPEVVTVSDESKEPEVVGGEKPEVLVTKAQEGPVTEPEVSTDRTEVTTIKVRELDSPEMILTSNAQDQASSEVRVVTPAAEIVASNELNSLFVTEHPIEHNMSPFLPDIENDTLIGILHSDGNFIGHPYTNSETNESRTYNLANDQLNHTNPLDASREDVTDLSVQGLNNDVSGKIQDVILNKSASRGENIGPSSPDSRLPPSEVSNHNGTGSAELPTSTQLPMVATTESMLGDLKAIPTTLPDHSGLASFDQTTTTTSQGLTNEISTKTSSAGSRPGNEPERDGENAVSGSPDSGLPPSVVSNHNGSGSAELPSSTELPMVATTETMLGDFRAVPTTLPDQSGLASFDQTTTATSQSLTNEISTKTSSAELNEPGGDGKNVVPGSPDNGLPHPVVSNHNGTGSAELTSSTQPPMVATTETMGDFRAVPTILPDKSGLASFDQTTTATSQGLTNEISTKTSSAGLNEPGRDGENMVLGSPVSRRPHPMVTNHNGTGSTELSSSTQPPMVPTIKTMLGDLKAIPTILPDQPGLVDFDQTTTATSQALTNEISTKTLETILDKPERDGENVVPGSPDSGLPPSVVSNHNGSGSAELPSSTQPPMVTTTETMLGNFRAVPTTLPDNSGFASFDRTSTATPQGLTNEISTKMLETILDKPGRDEKNMVPGSPDSNLPPPVVSNHNNSGSAELPISTQPPMVTTTETMLGDLKTVPTTLPEHSELSNFDRTTVESASTGDEDLSVDPVDSFNAISVEEQSVMDKFRPVTTTMVTSADRINQTGPNLGSP